MRDVTMELGGASRALRFRMPAWYALEQAGHGVTDFMAHFHEGPKMFTGIATLVWAMCQEADPPPSLKEVVSWLDLGNIVAAKEAIGAVLRETMPEPTGEPGNPQ